jgi:radical SAM superfamily enzyme YgiQ (UPF0313 family)
MRTGLWGTIERRLSEEIGTVRKDPGGKLRVCLAYPNTYFVGMSNLGFQAVYHLLNADPGVVCERAFVPDEDDLADLVRTGEELVSYESQAPLHTFDVLAFSVSYELDYVNVARLLRLAKVPARAAERETQHPLVIAGGPIASINPEPLAPLVDLFLVGEAEPALGALVQAIREHLGDRESLLAAAARVPGVYVLSAGAGAPVTRQYAADLDAYPTHSRILTPETEFGALFLVEVSRGCARQCRFCVTPSCYWPLRWRSAEAVMAAVQAGVQHRDAIGLVGAAVSDHPQIEEIAARIVTLGARLSVSSLRADSVSPALIAALAAGGARSLTIAPEAGSERLRTAISKGITEEHVITALRRAAEAGLREGKLYFMVGLPGEEQEDVAAIPVLVRTCLETTGLSRLTVSAGAFVPKPNTPYQRAAMLPVQELSRRLRFVRDSLRRERSVTLALESANWSYLEGALSRGDRRLGEVIIAAEAAGGNLAAWRRAFAAQGLTAAQFAGAPPPDPPPWGFIRQERHWPQMDTDEL